MENWVHDDSLFLSRRLGSSDGVVQVYRVIFTDTPLEENSFSLLGEAPDPSVIAPSVQWQMKDYIRLINFIQVNSLMVNVRGHVILTSEAKSRQTTSYWRCLDLLPLHVFGLGKLKPVYVGVEPNFLIFGGDVELSSTESTNDVSEVVEWKAKYENLDAAFKRLELERNELKASLALTSNSLSICEGEKMKLVCELEKLTSAYEQLEIHIVEIEVERQMAGEEIKLLIAEISDLKVRSTVAEDSLIICQGEKKKLVFDLEELISVNEKLKVRLDETDVERQKVSKETKALVAEISDLNFRLTVAGDSLIVSGGEKKKLVSEMEDLISANKKYQVSLDEIEVKRQKAMEEMEKLKAGNSDLQSRLNNSVSSLEKEKDSWAMKLAETILYFNKFNSPPDYSARYVSIDRLGQSEFYSVLNYRICGSITDDDGVVWNVHRNGTSVSLITARPFNGRDDKKHWRYAAVSWENSNKTGRLKMIM